MSIYYIITADRGCITGNGFFGNSVEDLIKAIRLGKTFKAPFPSVLSGYGFGGDFFAVGIKMDSYAFRADTVFIVIIVPHLAAGDCDSIGFDSIDHVITANRRRITGNLILGYGVNDSFAEIGFRKSAEAPGPAVRSRYGL